LEGDADIDEDGDDAASQVTSISMIVNDAAVPAVL